MTPYELPNVAGAGRVSDWFRWRLATRALELHLDPGCIFAVMAFESGLRADQQNLAGSGAVGLIQLMPAYADRFGGPAAVLDMSAEEQLERIVLPHFALFKQLRGSNNCGDYYMATFMPAFVGAEDDVVLGRYNDKSLEPVSKLSRHALYVCNFGFDAGATCKKTGPKCSDGVCSGGKGFYTVGDVKHRFLASVYAANKRPPIVVDLDTEPPRPADELGGEVLLGVAALGALFAIWRMSR